MAVQRDITLIINLFDTPSQRAAYNHNRIRKPLVNPPLHYIHFHERDNIVFFPSRTRFTGLL